eukprot:3687041-Pyramimonas_sp.AAC.1
MRKTPAGKAAGLDDAISDLARLSNTQVSRLACPLHLQTAANKESPWGVSLGGRVYFYKGKGQPCRVTDQRNALLDSTIAKYHQRFLRSASLGPHLQGELLSARCGGPAGRGLEGAVLIRKQFWLATYR